MDIRLRFCAACGKELVPGGRFCAFCGVKSGAPGSSAEDWLEELVSHDGAARERALREIQKLGPRADAALERLAASLGDPLAPGLPAEALLRLGRHVDAAVRAILDGLTKHESRDVRLTNLGSLMKCGERAASAVPGLRAALRDALRGNAAYEDVAENATRALGWIGPSAADALLEVLEALRHPDAKVRQAAAWTLGRFGGKAANAVFPLKDAATDRDPEVAKEAKKALKLIG